MYLERESLSPKTFSVLKLIIDDMLLNGTAQIHGSGYESYPPLWYYYLCVIWPSQFI